MLGREVIALNTFEHLEEEARRAGIEVIDYPFSSENIKGLYCDGTIAIRKTIDSQVEKSCVLAEEIGHHYTSSGNILDLSDLLNRKQERHARLYGYDLKIGLRGIIRAFKNGCKNNYEIAEYLEVTDDYLTDAIECYRGKYGEFVKVDNYLIYFIPSLAVLSISDIQYPQSD